MPVQPNEIADLFGMPPAAPTTSPTPTPSLAAPPTTSPGPQLISNNPTANQGIATDQSGRLPTSVAAQSIPMLTADPANPLIGQIWFRTDTAQLSVRVSTTTTKRVTLA